MLKNAIIFVIGAAVGGATAALITYKTMYDKIKKEADDKVRSMEEYVNFLRQKDEAGELLKNLDYVSKDGDEIQDYRESAEDSVGSGNSGDKKIEKKRRRGSTAVYTPYDQMYTGNGEHVDMTDPALSEHPTDNDEEEGGEDGVDEDERKRLEYSRRINEDYERHKGDRPKLIKAEEFDEYEYHDKVTLYFYTEDQILATEDNEIIDDPVAIVGDNLTKYGFNQNDEQVIFVRNIRRGTDYEIAKVFGPFEE